MSMNINDIITIEKHGEQEIMKFKYYFSDAWEYVVKGEGEEELMTWYCYQKSAIANVHALLFQKDALWRVDKRSGRRASFKSQDKIIAVWENPSTDDISEIVKHLLDSYWFDGGEKLLDVEWVGPFDIVDHDNSTRSGCLPDDEMCRVSKEELCKGNKAFDDREKSNKGRTVNSEQPKEPRNLLAEMDVRLEKRWKESGYTVVDTESQIPMGTSVATFVPRRRTKP